MSRIVVTNFVSLDGVVQAPLFPDEDRDGGFAHGGWVSSLTDEQVDEAMVAATVSAEAMLLGCRTYEVFAANWPDADPSAPPVAAMNAMVKYVASRTLTAGSWEPTVVLGPDVPAAVADLRARPGGDIAVFGSGELVATLLEHDLVDELRLITFPVVLGGGKGMFPTDGRRVDWEPAETTTTRGGTTISSYRPRGR